MRFSISSLILYIYVIVFAIWTYLAIFIMVLFSFNVPSSISYPFQGWTLKWYTSFNPAITSALWTSLQLALVCMVVSVGICLSAGLVLRKEFRTKTLVFYMVMMGMILPGVTLGMSTSELYQLIGIRQSIWTALPLHVTWAAPFGLFILLTRFDPSLLQYEEAARTLGASGWKVFREITFPLIANQVVAAALMGFLLSWGELMRTLFVTGNETTLPQFLFGRIVGHPVTPELFALGTVLTFSVLAVLMITAVLLTRGAGRKIV